MGVFSFLSKNKQEPVADEAYRSRADDKESTARARSKRASHAGAVAAASPRHADPVLPEKKRARRRLVGAIALALAVAVGLPMVLDSEPKPLNTDIPIQIPARDKPAAAPAPEPSAAALPAAPGAAALGASGTSRVAASAALDQSEEIVSTPPRSTPKPSAPAQGPVPLVEAKPRRSEAAEPYKPEKVAAKPERTHDSKPVEAAVVPTRPAARPIDKAAEKPTEKPAEKPARGPDDAERALAILEGKPAAKPAGKPAAEDPGSRFVLQVAALATQDKVDELQGKLRDAGIKSYTQRVPTASGERIRIRVGPFGSREEAEKARARLTKVGLSGSVVPP